MGGEIPQGRTRGIMSTQTTEPHILREQAKAIEEAVMYVALGPCICPDDTTQDNDAVQEVCWEILDYAKGLRAKADEIEGGL